MTSDYYLDKTFTASAGYTSKEEIKKNAKTVGFWKDGQDVSKLITPGWNETDEAKSVVRYIENSHKIECWKGYAWDRMKVRNHLGDADMVTPDFKWIFPEMHEYYIQEHSIRVDNENFIKDAVTWCNQLDYCLRNKDTILESVVNKTLLERQGKLHEYRLLCSKPYFNVDVAECKKKLQYIIELLDTVKGGLFADEYHIYDKTSITDTEEVIKYLFRYNHPLLKLMRL